MNQLELIYTDTASGVSRKLVANVSSEDFINLSQEELQQKHIDPMIFGLLRLIRGKQSVSDRIREARLAMRNANQ